MAMSAVLIFFFLCIMPFYLNLEKNFKNSSFNCFIFGRNFGWDRVRMKNLIHSELLVYQPGRKRDSFSFRCNMTSVYTKNQADISRHSKVIHFLAVF